MSELAEFLRARLAEDEQAAQAAEGETWDHASIMGDEFEQYVEVRVNDGSLLADNHVGSDTGLMAEDLIHIARHDPARVLREVEAKRQIIDEHEITDQGCETCGNYDPTGLHEHRTDGPCRTLRLLALPYADHPDYREEWKS